MDFCNSFEIKPEDKKRINAAMNRQRDKLKTTTDAIIWTIKKLEGTPDIRLNTVCKKLNAVIAELDDPEHWKPKMMRNGRIDNETHEWTGIPCPYCGYELKRVKSTGFKFCCNHEDICEYEEDVIDGKPTQEDKRIPRT